MSDPLPLSGHAVGVPLPNPDGFLLIDKPAGMTSHDAVDAARRALGCLGRKGRAACKVGHAGTLDPFATGLLVIGIGNATKRLNEILGLDKTYEAVARLGATSTTDDLEGEINVMSFRSPNESANEGEESQDFRDPSRSPSDDSVRDDISKKFSMIEIEEALDRFHGGYRQTAPAFSAKKVGGKKLYELARKGQVDRVERPVKDVKIRELVVTKYAWPELAFRVSCSSGTYVRALARDIGEALGCGAYLTALRRTVIGPYRVEDAISIKELNREKIEERLLESTAP